MRGAYSQTGEYCKQPAETSRNEESLSFQMHVSRSLPFNPQAAAVGIGGIVGATRTAHPILLLEEFRFDQVADLACRVA